jgi:hypothetical protein
MGFVAGALLVPPAAKPFAFSRGWADGSVLGAVAVSMMMSAEAHMAVSLCEMRADQ